MSTHFFANNVLFVICTSILFIFVCFRIFVLLYLFTNSFRRGFEELLLCERGDSARFYCLLCCSEHTLWTTFWICILYLYTPVLYILYLYTPSCITVFVFFCLVAQHTPLCAIVFIYSWVTSSVMIYDWR